MNADQDAIVAAASERIYARLMRAQENAEAVIREAADEVDAIRQQVLDSTCVEIIGAAAPPPTPDARHSPAATSTSTSTCTTKESSPPAWSSTTGSWARSTASPDKAAWCASSKPGGREPDTAEPLPARAPHGRRPAPSGPGAAAVPSHRDALGFELPQRAARLVRSGAELSGYMRDGERSRCGGEEGGGTGADGVARVEGHAADGAASGLVHSLQSPERVHGLQPDVLKNSPSSKATIARPAVRSFARIDWPDASFIRVQ